MTNKGVPEGYKQTEVGVIPEDWASETLGAIGSIQMCKRIFSNQTSSTAGIPFFKIGTFGKEPNAYIPFKLYSEFKNLYSYPKTGDVLISASGTIGRTVIFDGSPAYFQDSNIVWLDLNREKIGNDYLYHYYQIIKWAYPEGTTISRLYNDVIRSTNIAIPPTKAEQTEIATALSDVDALITQLEKLIAKKRQIKQGAMQTLLNPLDKDGKLKDGWEEKLLSSMGNTFGGLSGKNKNDFGCGNSRYVPFTNVILNIIVDKNSLEMVNVNEKQNQVCKNDLLFNGSSETPEEVCYCSLVDYDYQDVYLNSFCFGYRANCENTFSPLYLAYWFRSTWGRQAVSSIAQGSTRYNISKNQFLNLKLLLPNFLDQLGISNTFKDIDSEITALETKLAKTQKLKQGMMQSLLTGQIRLLDKVTVNE